MCLWMILARLGNHIATDKGNFDFRYSKKMYIQSWGSKYKVVDFISSEVLNDMSLD